MSSLQHLLSHTRSGDVTVTGQMVGDDLHIRRHYDYTALLEGHRLSQEAMDAGEKLVIGGKDFWPVATIPAHVLDDMIRNGWMQDTKRLRKWVNDPANADFVYERKGKKIRL